MGAQADVFMANLHVLVKGTSGPLIVRASASATSDSALGFWATEQDREFSTPPQPPAVRTWVFLGKFGIFNKK